METGPKKKPLAAKYRSLKQKYQELLIQHQASSVATSNTADSNCSLEAVLGSDLVRQIKELELTTDSANGNSSDYLEKQLEDHRRQDEGSGSGSNGHALVTPPPTFREKAKFRNRGKWPSRKNQGSNGSQNFNAIGKKKHFRRGPKRGRGGSKTRGGGGPGNHGRGQKTVIIHM